MSKKVESIQPNEPGLYAYYGGNAYLAAAAADYDPDTGEVIYGIAYHKGEMPAFNGETFKTREELEAAMRQVQPDMRRWRESQE